jgi:hypothetical protein
MNGESLQAKESDRGVASAEAHDEIPQDHLSTSRSRAGSESDNDGGDEFEQGAMTGFGQNDEDIETGIPVPSSSSREGNLVQRKVTMQSLAPDVSTGNLIESGAVSRNLNGESLQAKENDRGVAFAEAHDEIPQDHLSTTRNRAASESYDKFEEGGMTGSRQKDEDIETGIPVRSSSPQGGNLVQRKGTRPSLLDPDGATGNANEAKAHCAYVSSMSSWVRGRLCSAPCWYLYTKHFIDNFRFGDQIRGGRYQLANAFY